jgi:ATP-binding cassette subfamily A (ABC1) protein 3
MWRTLRRIVPGKAVVITTHSMEEATALSTKVGIISRRLLAVGTTQSLAARYPFYEVHFSARTREELQRAQDVMKGVPGAKMADDVATRFEVPLMTAGPQ